MRRVWLGADVGRQNRWLPRLQNRSDEFISAAGNIHQVSIAVATVTQRSAQRSNMNLEIGFFDYGVRPNPSDQFPFTDHLPWSLDQDGQDFHCATSKANWLVRFQQHLLCWK